MNENRLKNVFWGLLNVFIIGLIVVIFAVVLPGSRQFLSQVPPTRTINVSAEGKATVKPDIAQVSFSVISRGQNPADIATENNKKISAVIDEMKKQGIESKDIKTTSYNLNPIYAYDHQTGKSSIQGYELSQGVDLKIRDLSRANTVLAALPSLGVNNISQLNFTLDDPEAARAEARKQAFDRAREKASTMAQQAGISLGKVVSVSESGDSTPIYNMKAAYDMGAGAARNQVAVPAPTLEPGSQEVTVNVSITYAIQ